MDNHKKMVTHILKKALIVLIAIISVLFSITLIKIENKKDIIKETIQTTIPIKITKTKILEIEKPIGKIIIPKIKIEKPLYEMNSSKNNIEENITILNESTYPNNEKSILFIAAHSGTGSIAFFEQLDQLTKEDEIEIIYQNKSYIYTIKTIEEQKKDGYIRGKIENKRQLVLTTCCPHKDNCQLIINAIEKEF